MFQTMKVISLFLEIFNSRTSTLPDFVEYDNFNVGNVDILPDGYQPDIEINRLSEDQGHVNNNGRLLLIFVNKQVSEL